MATGTKWPLAIGAGGILLLMATGVKAATMVKRKVTIKDVTQAKALVQKWIKVFPRVELGWAMAIIGNESRFNPDAKNLTSPGDVARGGAWGYMQMTLKTAQGVAGQLQVLNNAAVFPVLRTWDKTGPGLLNPNLNIMMGVGYLDQLAKSLGDNARANPRLVVAAYNRGLGGVKAMLAKGLPMDGLAYVQNVEAMRNQLLESGVFA